ncbi:ISNCY family transposase [Sphingomonas sp. ID0503]|uniref:ISNCY family transposase n=1 Tax=Sphingomonas sp. ID0503 TaxID=3399691 RepID=UPI003AFA0D66
MKDAVEPVVDDGSGSYTGKAIQAYIDGTITAKDLQASLGVARAYMYRLIDRYRHEGEAGLVSKKYGNRNRARSERDRERIMKLVREHYSDFGPTLAAEKLLERHREKVTAETLRQWMKEDGLWTDRRSREPKIYSPREPRPCRGELVQVDGSYHRWFEKRGDECCLIVFIDDATSELKHLQFVEHETSYNYMWCLKIYIERFGVPKALFSDRHAIFRVPNLTAEGERGQTQFARACSRLAIQTICAKTPQAKGRVERANRTLQNRLIKEMRLRSISTMEEGNRFLDEYRRIHNEKFARQPRSDVNAHGPAPNLDLSSLMTYTVERKVFKDLTVSFNKIRYVLDESEISRKAIGKRVTVAVPLEGDVEIIFDEVPLPYKTFDKIRRVPGTPEVLDHKQLGAAFVLAKAISGTEPHHFQRNGHVLAGFRKQFSDPSDLRSKSLQGASASVRKKFNGRPRTPLGRHPIVIIEPARRK